MDIYLDNAATSHPKPFPVLQAVMDAMTLHNGNPGRSGHRRALDGARILLSGREALASFFHVEDPFRFIYSLNCTDALNLAIKGTLRKADHVITSLVEHNSVLRVLTELREENQIDLTLIAPARGGIIDPVDIEMAITKKTRLVVLTQASNVTGAIQPIHEVGAICRERGVRFLVDGAQGAGCLPTDLPKIGCDLYAFPGHKALLGPQGTGGLYIAPGIPLRIIREGGTGSSSDSMRQPNELPEGYESGTANLHGIAGLDAGVRYVSDGFGDILYHERALTDQMIRGLRHISGVTVYGPAELKDRVGVVSFNVGDLTSSQVADALDLRGFSVRGGLHCAPGAHQFLGTLRRGAVRASIGYANTAGEIDRFLRQIHAIARDGS